MSEREARLGVGGSALGCAGEGLKVASRLAERWPEAARDAMILAMAREYVIRVTQDAESQPVEHRISGLPIGIGRDPANEVQVASMFVSGYHARIEEVKGRLFVRDLGSRNGTQVPTPDGVKTRVAAQALYDLSHCGYEFFLGSTVRVEVVDPDRIGDSFGWGRGREAPRKAAVDSFLDAPARGGLGIDDLPPLPGAGAPPGGNWNSSPPPVDKAFGDGPLSLPPLPGEGARAVQDRPPKFRDALPPRQKFDALGASAWHALPAGNAAAGALQTGNFQLTMESLALQGLRELVASLLPGQTLQTQGDVARLITRLHDAAEVLCRSLIPLRQSYLEFVSSLELQKSAHYSRAGMVLDMARDPAAVAAVLLDFREGAEDASTTLEKSLHDLTLHQVALLEGVMQGVRALLEELSPTAISAAADDRRGSLRIGGREKAAWEEYCQRYEQLTDESQAFSRIFGEEFAQAYRHYRRRGAK